jgi:hypothetical protein
MKTIASHDISTTTVQLSLDLSQLIAYLSSLDTEILKQIIRSLGAELSERQEIPLSDVFKEIFSEKVLRNNSPDWDQWFAEVDELSSVSSPPDNLPETPLLDKYRKQGLKI